MSLFWIRLVPRHSHCQSADWILIEHDVLLIGAQTQFEIDDVAIGFGRVNGDFILFMQWIRSVRRNESCQRHPTDFVRAFFYIEQLLEMLLSVLLEPILVAVNVPAKASEDSVLPWMICRAIVGQSDCARSVMHRMHVRPLFRIHHKLQQLHVAEADNQFLVALLDFHSAIGLCFARAWNLLRAGVVRWT